MIQRERSTKMYLQIPLKVWSKVNYFLKAFPSNEWSGPAWYKPIFRKDEKFPKGFELVHFHPVDLGHGTATTIEAGETAKTLTKTWKEYPETEKCMMGIIHSHHSMGAFFSGTDKSCIEDNAPAENFYCSTVVASAKERFAFAVGYKDHYDNVHIFEADDDDIKMKMPPDTQEAKWKYIATKIEKQRKETTVTGYYGRGGNFSHGGQGSLWGHQGGQAINGYGYPINFDESTDRKLLDKMAEQSMFEEEPENAFLGAVAEAYVGNKIMYESFALEVTKLGLDPVRFLEAYKNDEVETILVDMEREGGTNVIALPETSEKSGPNSAGKA